MESRIIRVGSRRSELAMVQTRWVIARLKEIRPEQEFEIVNIITVGDRILDKPLVEFGGKGAFIGEFESALLNGNIDLAVHSAKDLPGELAEGLTILATPLREDPADILVLRKGAEANFGKDGSGLRIGTGSRRRQMLLPEEIRAECVPLRGNVPTRLGRIDEGLVDGVVLAAAGLKRLGLDREERFTYIRMEPESYIPAGGQGILAVEGRKGDPALCFVKQLHDADAGLCLAAEREVLKELGASCNMAVGVYAKAEEDRIQILAAIGTDETEQPVFAGKVYRAEAGGAREDYRSAAREAAEKLAVNAAPRPGFVSLVGAGPGDAGLITVRGRQLLMECDAVIYDRLAGEALLQLTGKSCKRIYVGKEPGKHSKTQEEINEILVKEALKGQRIVRLKGGDSFVFGRGGEEIQALRESGIGFEVIPGITSAISVPEVNGIPVTHRGVSQSFHVITAHTADSDSGMGEDLKNLAALRGTLVFLMGMEKLSVITEGLIAGGKEPETPAAVIQNGTQEKQKKVLGTLSNIAERVKEADVGSPAIILVGEVAALSFVCENHTACGGRTQKGDAGKALVGAAGSRNFVSRFREEYGKKGGETVDLGFFDLTDSTRDETFQDFMKHIGEFEWLVFTSANGVEMFFRAVRAAKTDYRVFAGRKFAVIGSATAESLEKQGFQPDLCPDLYSGESLAAALAERIREEALQSGRKPGEIKAALLRSAKGGAGLPEKLADGGISCLDVSVYDALCDEDRLRETAKAIGTCQCLAFGSSFSVRTLFDLLEQTQETEEWKRIPMLCIGSVTADTARSYGCVRVLSPEVFTVEGMVEKWMSRQES